MASHMKTTVEISDSLLEEARRLASRERSTLRALIEDGLRRLLREKRSKQAFRLRNATFRGEGLQPGAAEGGWTRIRDLVYQDRGA